MRLIKTIPVKNVPIHWLLIGTVVGGVVGWFTGWHFIETFAITGGLTVGLMLIATIGLFAFAGSQMMAFLAGAPIEDT